MNTLELIAAAQNGDETAKERLVTDNAGLVWSVARKFAGRGAEAEDLYQLGAIGLIKCIAKFDARFGVKFSTYAVPMIMGEIRRFLRDDGLIKVSRPLKELNARALRAREAMRQKTGREPTVEELSETLGVEAGELITAMSSAQDVESLNATLRGDSAITLMDTLDRASPADLNPADQIALKDLINNLPPRERQVITLRYFQDKTQSEVAAAIGVSQVQVSRIEKRVLQSMREEFIK